MKNFYASNLNCASCRLCLLQDLNGNILCWYKGITTYNFYCSRYKPKRISPRPTKLLHTFITCSKCKYFDDSISKNEQLGVCKYYKLRPFQGDERKACSNYLNKEPETASKSSEIMCK